MQALLGGGGQLVLYELWVDTSIGSTLLEKDQPEPRYGAFG